MIDPLTTALLFLLIPLLVFLLLAYWLDKNKERMLFLVGFDENKRTRPRNSFLTTLITQPDNTRVWGVDESGRWAGIVDWKVTRSRGASFAIIKCTEGTVNSPYFVENITGAIAAGLVAGGYHWLHQNSVISCKAQAQAAWNRIKAFPKILPLVIDLEATRWNGQQRNPTYSDAELFADEYTRISGRKAILYSSPGYLAALGPIPMSLRTKLAGIHIAHYGVVTPDYADWILHQFSPEGDASYLTPNTLGKKEVDLNYWRGSLAGLRQLAGLEDNDPTPIPPPEPEEPMTITYRGEIKPTALSGSRVRVQADLSASIVTTLAPGTPFEAQGQLVPNDGYDWLNLVTPVAGWLAITSNVAYAPAEPPAPADSVTVTLDQTVRATINGVRYVAHVVSENVEMVRE